MPPKARRVILLALGFQVVWSLPLGLFFSYRWLAFDDPDHSYACRTAGNRPAMCTEGEVVNMWLGIGFTALALAFALVVVILAVRFGRRRRREEYLRAHGMRARAVVTDVVITGTKINGRPLFRLRGSVPGQPEIRFDMRTFDLVPAMTPVTVAYDPSSPGEAIIVAEREPTDTV